MRMQAKYEGSGQMCTMMDYVSCATSKHLQIDSRSINEWMEQIWKFSPKCGRTGFVIKLIKHPFDPLNSFKTTYYQMRLITYKPPTACHHHSIRRMLSRMIEDQYEPMSALSLSFPPISRCVFHQSASPHSWPLSSMLLIITRRFVAHHEPTAWWMMAPLCSLDCP